MADPRDNASFAGTGSLTCDGYSLEPDIIRVLAPEQRLVR